MLIGAGCGASPSSASPERVDSGEREATGVGAASDVDRDEFRRRFGFELPDYGELVSGLVIDRPKSNTTVAPGPLHVVLTPIDGFEPARVFVASRLGSALIEEPPWSAEIEVPRDAIGTFELSAIAFDAGWNMAATHPVTLRVEPAARLTGIRFFQEAYLFDFGPESQMRVIGGYDDGIERELTAPELGTRYESLHPEVATIDDNGVVRAVSAGVATVRATHAGHQATTRVYVQSVPSPG